MIHSLLALKSAYFGPVTTFAGMENRSTRLLLRHHRSTEAHFANDGIATEPFGEPVVEFGRVIGEEANFVKDLSIKECFGGPQIIGFR